MGVSDPQFTRLKTLLIIFLLIFFIYTSEIVIFGTGQKAQDDLIEPFHEKTYKQPEQGLFDQIATFISGIAGIIVLIFQILTFTLPSIPFWMTVIMLPIIIVICVIMVYIFIDILYDIAKALPFT
jgi:hypothetical protein